MPYYQGHSHHSHHPTSTFFLRLHWSSTLWHVDYVTFPTGVFIFPACRYLSPLIAEEGCRFPLIHDLHAANMEPVRWFCGRYFLVVLRLHFFSAGVFSLLPACRNLSPLLAEEGCRYPSIHALHAVNMEPVPTRFGDRYFSVVLR